MWYKPENESAIATPCVLLYPDRIEENIRRMIALAGSAERLRPHVKTHKIAEVIKLQLLQGIYKFKCATLPELALAAAAGGNDILLAYPLLGPSIQGWLKLVEQYPQTKMSVTVDSETALKKLESHFREKNKTLEVFVDIDNGMHRTGIEAEQAGPLIDYIVKSRNLRFRGLHIYDGHIHEVDPIERKLHCDRDFEEVIQLVEKLKAKRIETGELACGGTPTFPIHASHSSRTLCPGTPLLWDAGYATRLPDLDFLQAAVVAGRVISKPGSVVCLDLGYKSIASEMKHPRLQFLDLQNLEEFAHSEEHLVLSFRETDPPAVGEVVYALPFHICPTMALHERVYVVRNQKVTETWTVAARNRNYPL